MTIIKQQFTDFYAHFGHDSISRLHHIYAEDVKFIDPIHRIHGLPELTLYFQNLMQQTHHCHFQIQSYKESNEHHFVEWDMRFAHPKLNAGNEIQLSGISTLRVKNNKVVYQQDYYDLGAMLYEHIPLLGRIVRFFKHRL
ncbi:nuclear transport factor 2 family protein [Alteromonas sp. a30]|uniref:nuclear transport factor 2 family protein n=1 Tax=Alteromonas sp. a30 TaxID=2730917 RepID=UPI002281440F|nr:nuclear transport factor 2 family protein [Alteromonas sp. a30]MCY7297112.1 nuclear transport factor 2 family protein [Alteromonas sp. a30]